MITVRTAPGFTVNGRKQARIYLQLPQTGSLRDVQLGWLQWFGADFSGLRLENVIFTRCDFAAAHFDKCELLNVTFVECTLTGATFPGAGTGDWSCVDCVLDLKTVPSWV